MEQFRWVLMRYYLIYRHKHKYTSFRYFPILSFCDDTMASLCSWWLHLSHWWCWTIWVTRIASCTLLKPFLESIRTFLLLLFFSSVADFCFLFISFLIWWSLHSKVASYQSEYNVHDEVGGCSIVMYFYATMVNNKKHNFCCFC